MKVKIDVTAKDIKNGIAVDGENCPIGRAVQRVGFKGVCVSNDEFEFNFGEFAVNLPKKASKFISKFDAGTKVKPFTFVINIPNNIASNLTGIKKAYIVATKKAARKA